jgi:heptosyltransferase II
MVQTINKRKELVIKIVNNILRIYYHLNNILTFRFLKNKKDIKIKKILIVNYGYLGDSILNIPLIKSIRSKFKDAKITMVINPKFKDIWNNFDSVDQIIEYDCPWIRYGYKIRLNDIKEYFKLIKILKKEKFDLAIDSRGDLRNNMLLYHSNAKQRIGFTLTGGSYFLTDRLKWEHQHEVENSLKIAKKLGCKIKENYPILNINKKHLEKADQIINKFKLGKNIIAIAPGAGYPTKELSVEKWIELTEQIPSKYNIVLIGGPNEYKFSIIKEKSRNKNILNLIGELKLLESAAIIKKSKLLISPDSGSAHLAAAVGTKTITLFGPTDEIRWRPYGPKDKHIIIRNKIECSPCGLTNKCEFNKKCMVDIDTLTILDKMRAFL